MKKASIYISIFFLICAIAFSCSEDVENPTIPERFANYKTWNKLEEYQGAQLSGLAHGADDLRKIFINRDNNNLEADNELPLGTILVKEINGGETALLAMEKKSKGEKGWEYWDLKAGTNLGTTNDCQACHETATTDYSFSLGDL